MATTIYWFSGTGNSLYTAKKLADELGDTKLCRMAAGVPSDEVGGSGEKIGFVFPSYYNNLPRFVRSFAKEIKIKDGTYLFAIVTMGGLGQGALAELETEFSRKNLSLDYGRSILISGNYVINYNPADPGKIIKKLEKTDAKIRKISEDIKGGLRSVKKIKLTADNLYKNIEALDANFFAEESCTGCGQCAKLCPVKNIAIKKGRPAWLHHCEHCVACISWCPARAIQYGAKTKSRRRYRNPNINVNEMM